MAIYPPNTTPPQRGLNYVWNFLGSSLKTLANALKPYLGGKSYVALLTQTGTNAPVATVLENTLGDLSYTYFSPGLYYITSNSLFIREKLWYYIQPNINASTGIRFNITYIDNTTLLIEDQNYTDDSLNYTSIEIRVYP